MKKKITFLAAGATVCLLTAVGTTLLAKDGVWADSLCNMSIPGKCTWYKEDKVTVDFECDGYMQSKWDPDQGIEFPSKLGDL